jgi:hypothetical protein
MGTKRTDDGLQAADAEGNPMGTKKYDVEEQIAIARDWEKSGLSQEAWATKHGITARTLRLYLRRHCPARHWNEEIQAVVLCANQALTEILKTMGPQAADTPVPRPAAAPVPGPKGKFNWGD